MPLAVPRDDVSDAVQSVPNVSKVKQQKNLGSKFQRNGTNQYSILTAVCV